MRRQLVLLLPLASWCCAPPPAPPPQEARALAFGLIGQSNMLGLGNVRRHPGLPDLTGIRLFQLDAFRDVDDEGVFTQLDFDPARYDVPTSSYDYPVNSGVPPFFASVPLFGPEVHVGAALRDHFGAPIHLVKLAPGGVTLSARELPPPGLPASWFWPAHAAWDVDLPRSNRPYTATVHARGTSTETSATGLADRSQRWRPDEHVGRWLVAGGKQGLVLGNSADALTIETWVPDPAGPPPSPGPYVLEDRVFFAAGLARTFTDGYLRGAARAVGGRIDYRGTFVAQGETDALRPDTARAAKDRMLALIAHVRQFVHEHGMSTRARDELPFVLGLVKPTERWPYAAVVNAGFREIAAADPWVRLVDTADIALGGFDGVDPAHYGTEGQIEFGRRLAAAMLEMLAQPAGTRH